MASDEQELERFVLELEIDRLRTEVERQHDEYAQLAALLFGEAEWTHDDVHRRLAETLNEVERLTNERAAIEAICRSRIIGHVIVATVPQLVEMLSEQAGEMQRQRDALNDDNIALRAERAASGYWRALRDANDRAEKAEAETARWRRAANRAGVSDLDAWERESGLAAKETQ